MEPARSRHIAVFGLGYVGCVTAACLAKLGHRVYGVDKDAAKAGAVMAGRAPFFEPGLEEVIGEALAAGRLSAGDSAASALEHAEIAIICVGTPSAPDGDLSTSQLERVFAEVAHAIAGRTAPLVVALRSTVFPGTTEVLAAPLVAAHPGVAVVANPEFLREGAAVSDFLDPPLLVVGGASPDAVCQVAALYPPGAVPACLVSLRAAEMIKYCCNAFHALKITFANEVGTLAECIGVAPGEVMDTLCRDTRLNISPAYLKPGFAFGGSCLPKDLRALTCRAARLDLQLPLLESVLESNQCHLDRAVCTVLEAPARRIGVYGLAFKENTDDLRESAVVAAVERWAAAGRDVRVHDPHITLDSIYGSNRNFLLAALPHVSRLLEPDLGAMLAWCDCVVTGQVPGGDAAQRIAASGKRVIDLAGARWRGEP